MARTATKSRKKSSGTSKKCVVPKTKKFGDKVFRVSTKVYTKAQAQKAAERHRSGGKSKQARVIPNPCGSGFRVAKRG